MIARTLTGITSRTTPTAGRARSRTRVALALLLATVTVLALSAAPAFAAAPETPEVSVESVTAGSATLHGVLNPLAGGLVEGGSYQFVYRPSSKDECEGAGEVLAPGSPGLALGLPQEQVFEGVGGLSADTEYAVCVVARNLKGEPALSAPAPFTTAIPPETPEAKPAKPVTASEATLHGVLNPNSERVSEPGGVEFRYRQSPSECQGGAPGEEQAVGPQTAPEGHKEEATQATIGGLLPGRDYTYCVIATNNAGEASAPSVPVTFTALTVEGESSSEVSLANATVEAQVYPGGLPTTYSVEYGTSTAYGSSTPVTSAGAAAGPVSVAVQLSGLEPGTLYHYRFVVSNTLGTQTASEGATFTTSAPAPAAEASSCPNEASRQGPSAALPDCRAYEQITPVDKGGAEDLFPTSQSAVTSGEAGSLGYPSESGDQFLLSSDAELDEYGSSGGHSVYLFSRGVDGWTTKSLVEPGLGVQSVEFVLFDPADFSQFGLSLQAGSQGGAPENARQEAHLVGPAGGPYATIDHPESEAEEGRLVGGSADLSHVVLASIDHKLAPGDAGQEQVPRGFALYEWAGGPLSLVNVETGGSLISPCGAVLGEGGAYGGSYRAVSSDGSKIFFTAPDPRLERKTGCWGGPTEWGGKRNSSTVLIDPPQVYMRVDGTSTVDVSAPAPDAKEQTHYPAVYVGASADGEKVFFLSKGELTANAVGHDPELYEYDSQTGVLTRVSRGVSGTAEGNVVQVPAISSDGSTVYFTAHSQLTPGAPEAPEEGENERTVGQVNLYRYDTNSETTTYIATIAADEYPSDVAGIWYGSYLDESEVVGLDPQANWYTTADGQYLVFASAASLTGYDSVAANGVACETLIKIESVYGDCSEVYLYSAASNRVVCVSCDPSGAPPEGNAEFARSAIDEPSATSPRPVSEDGSYVFFDSASALAPGALNGVLHVYEWHDGEVSSIGAAGDPSASFFLGSSASGADVFFGTHSQLVAQDTDQAGDVYDARIDGGFEGLAPPACTGTGCQGVPGAPPIFATPASVTFAGVGNFASEPPRSKKTAVKKKGGCRRGFRRVGRKGRCVKAGKPKRMGKSAHSDRRASR